MKAVAQNIFLSFSSLFSSRSLNARNELSKTQNIVSWKLDCFSPRRFCLRTHACSCVKMLRVMLLRAKPKTVKRLSFGLLVKTSNGFLKLPYETFFCLNPPCLWPGDVYQPSVTMGAPIRAPKQQYIPPNNTIFLSHGCSTCLDSWSSIGLNLTRLFLDSYLTKAGNLFIAKLT